MFTAYHAKYFAHALTLRHAADGVDRLSQSLFDASVDLNPHQIEAALVLGQYWAERKRRLLIICPAVLPLQMHLERVGLQLTQAGIATSGIMQSEILQRSGRLHEFRLNPQAFITQAASQINHTLHALMLRGIEYVKIAGQQWEMQRLEDSAEQQLERYLDNLYKVNHQGKALFDYVEYQSETEKKFAQELDDDERVKFFVKLPGWFKVDTPVGPYNPDWAIVFEQGLQQHSRLYLVRETKSTLLKEKLRQEENDKILCGGKHFAAIGVDYAVATSMRDVVQDLSARAML